MMLVDVLLRQGRSADAMAILDEGKKSGVLIPEWWLRKGYILLQQGRAEEAKQEFEAALALDNKNVEATVALGLSEESLHHYLDAASYYEAVPRDNKLYPEARKRLAFLALKQDEPKRAVSIMEKLYQEKPDAPDVVVTFSAVLRDAGDYDRAETVIQKALAKSPDDAGLNSELALIYYGQDRVDASIKVMQKMLDIDPRDAQALNFIGYTWAEQGVRLDEAESYIRRALEINPDSGAFMDSLGWVFFQRGDYQSAMKWLQKALAAIGPDPEVLEHAGDCYRAMGDQKQARENYEKALDNASSMKIKKRIRKKLEDMP
jgi:tetratricopeptide (TPR) repeat protein